MSEETTVVDATEKSEVVLSSGVAMDLWEESDSTFLPVLKKDLPIAERKTAVRSVIKQVVQVDDKLQLMAGEMLYEINRNEYWKEWTFTDDTGEIRNFKSFEEYLREEIDFGRKKAFDLIKIYQVFVVELGISTEILGELEWSKARLVVNVINEDNWPDIIDMLKKSSVREVKEFVSKTSSPKKTSPAKSSKGSDATISFRAGLASEQAEVVDEAMKQAETMTGSEKTGANLDYICQDFLSGLIGTGKDGLLSKLDVQITNLERVFGVKLKVSEVDPERFEKVS